MLINDEIFFFAGYYSSEPIHLRNVTKVDLWRMWQDSELELRQRLCQVEEERNILASHLSQKYKTDPEQGNRYEDEFYRRELEEGLSSEVDPNSCLNVELEVPFEFRDPSSKDLRNRRYSRSLDEERSYRSVRGPGSGTYMDYAHCDDLLGCKNAMEKEYDDFFRSVRSLEDSLLGDNDLRSSDSRRKPHHTRASKSKPLKRKRDQPANLRRCKSSLDSRRSRSLARESQSGSSESLKTERISASSFDTRSTSRSSRGRSRKKKASPSPLGDFSDKSSIGRDYRRRKSKSKGDKLSFLSLPRNKPQHRKKYSNTLSYCSQSSSSDPEAELVFREQSAEPSPLPLLQSLQRHSFGKQHRAGTSAHNQKQKTKPFDPLTFDPRHGRKSLRKVSPYIEKVPYLVRESPRLPVPADSHHSRRETGSRSCHGTYHENHACLGAQVVRATRRRSSLNIPEPRSVSELY